ncbi:MAG: hypothetical protein IJ373_04725, partial [Clostridia bacterium]|nr:hypothetical protein [Clostridia bacterium]
MKGKFLKILAVLACLTLSAGVAACGGKDDGVNGSGSGSLTENSSSEIIEDESSEVSLSVEDNSSEEIVESSVEGGSNESSEDEYPD